MYFSRQINRKLALGFSLLLILILVPSAATAITLSGTVTYSGPRPHIRPIPTNGDITCGHRQITPDVLVISPKGQVANALVYVTNSDPPLPPKPIPKIPVVISQHGCVFTPHATAIIAGQHIQFINPDTTLHNVHISSRKNRSKNMMSKPNAVNEVTFTQPELMIPISCEVHPWMSAVVSVLPNGYFALTSPTGAFAISGLPAGKLTIHVVHERLGHLTQKIVLAPASKPIIFEFHP